MYFHSEPILKMLSGPNVDKEICLQVSVKDLLTWISKLFNSNLKSLSKSRAVQEDESMAFRLMRMLNVWEL